MDFIIRYPQAIAQADFARDELIREAEEMLHAAPRSVREFPAPERAAAPGDYYSNGDYWWPDPKQPDGLPFIRRDGKSYPGAFSHHREVAREMRRRVAVLAQAAVQSGRSPYAHKAIEFLKLFFVDENTRMNPHLRFAQAIPGRCTGRGIGIIDTLHFVDLPLAIEVLEKNAALLQLSGVERDTLNRVRAWFADYLDWLIKDDFGKDELEEGNNHSIAYLLQVAGFARFVGRHELVCWCRRWFKERILPEQMAEDGSFPLELSRTRPYNYSLFTMDLLSALAHIISDEEEYLWEYSTADGRNLRRGVDFIVPYIRDKARWTRNGYGRDTENFDQLPDRRLFLLLAAGAFDMPELTRLWNSISNQKRNREVRRNNLTRAPLLWALG